jgi:hypothetical protein
VSGYLTAFVAAEFDLFMLDGMVAGSGMGVIASNFEGLG